MQHVRICENILDFVFQKECGHAISENIHDVCVRERVCEHARVENIHDLCAYERARAHARFDNVLDSVYLRMHSLYHKSHFMVIALKGEPKPAAPGENYTKVSWLLNLLCQMKANLGFEKFRTRQL